MRGLTYLERRALIVDPSAENEGIPEVVFRELIRLGRAHETLDGHFEATAAGLLALEICPMEPKI